MVETHVLTHKVQDRHIQMDTMKPNTTWEAAAPAEGQMAAKLQGHGGVLMAAHTHMQVCCSIGAGLRNYTSWHPQELSLRKTGPSRWYIAEASGASAALYLMG